MGQSLDGAARPVRRHVRLALDYADAITLTDRDVGDALFERLREFFDDDAIVELTELIAWENASSKSIEPLRIGSQHLSRP